MQARFSGIKPLDARDLMLFLDQHSVDYIPLSSGKWDGEIDGVLVESWEAVNKVYRWMSAGAQIDYSVNVR